VVLAEERFQINGLNRKAFGAKCKARGSETCLGDESQVGVTNGTADYIPIPDANKII
jgi:hypothetical protein